MNAKMTIEILPGTSIEEASVDAQRIATTLRIGVEFTFNGVTCLARPYGSSKLLASRQMVEQCRELAPLNDCRKTVTSQWERVGRDEDR